MTENPETTTPIREATEQLLTLRRADRDLLLAGKNQHPDSRAWLSATFPRVEPLVPHDMDPALDRNEIPFSLAELEDWNTRLETCLRCPAEGGACAEQEIIPRPGAQPVWDPATKHLVARRCDRWAEYALSRYLVRHGVPESVARSRFASYTPASIGQGLALDHAKNFVKRSLGAIGERLSLVLYGPSGRGKTHLAVATLASLASVARRDRPPTTASRWILYRDTTLLMREAREALDSDDRDEPTNQAADASVLVLEDVGSTRLTDWASEELVTLLRRRASEARPTLVTTRDPRRFEHALGDHLEAFARTAVVVELT